jgi:hypothetical protein
MPSINTTNYLLFVYSSTLNTIGRPVKIALNGLNVSPQANFLDSSPSPCRRRVAALALSENILVAPLYLV